MKIYEYEGFPNPARIRIALAEKNLTDKVEFVSVDVPAGEHKTAGYLKKNPSGTVPALELDDGTVISECTAITEYIDSAFGQRTLTGGTAKQRAVIHMMQRRAENQVLDAVGAYFHHATQGLGPEIEGEQCVAWGSLQRACALDGMAYFDTVLASQPFVAGEAFSMADITLYAGLGFAAFAKIDIPPECANLIAWQSRMAERPAIAA